MVERKLKALRVDLNKVLASDLLEIKDYYGIQSDSDIIRFLIREHKKELLTKEDFHLLTNNHNHGAYVLQDNGSYERISSDDINITIDKFDVELIRFILTPILLSNILRGILLKKPILLLIEQDFIYKHIQNFFTFIFDNTFSFDISFSTEKLYLKNEQEYSNSLVFKGDQVIKDEQKILSKKKLKIEKEIVQKFFSENELKFSLIVLKNEIKKAFIMANKMIPLVEKGEKLSSKEIANFLKEIFSFDVNFVYIEFLTIIIKDYFEIDVPEIYNTLSDFL
ncbi:MAG: hypothetical protein ACFFAS_07635 [Promethearchaeota archaeon]